MREAVARFSFDAHGFRLTGCSLVRQSDGGCWVRLPFGVSGGERLISFADTALHDAVAEAAATALRDTRPSATALRST